LKCDNIKRLITLTNLSCRCSSIVVLKCEALRNNFCFGKTLSSRPTSTIRKTRKRQLNSLYNEFGNYSLIIVYSLINISVLNRVLIVIFFKKTRYFYQKTRYNHQKLIFNKTRYTLPASFITNNHFRWGRVEFNELS
jgi:hypothetical protein